MSAARASRPGYEPRVGSSNLSGRAVDQRLVEMQAVLFLARAYACYVGDEALERFKKRCAQFGPKHSSA